MVRLINIDPAHERIIPMLYPQYSLETTLTRYNRFILKKDITNPNERRILSDNYDEAIVISTKLYDEFWDADILREKALNFRRTNFKTRKKTLNDIPADDPQDFIDNLVSFMFTGEYSFIEDESINELFNAFGTLKFNDLFMQEVNKHPLPKVIASMFTFLSKIKSDAFSVYYKKKYQALGDKLARNFLPAFDYLKTHEKSELHYLYFFQLLVK